MDINNLKAFIEVADKKSFSRSAEALNLSQPAVSKRVAVLETELSAKLFDRVGRDIQLTEAGRLLLPCARQISRELSRVKDVICNLDKNISGAVSISSCEQIGSRHLPPLLALYRKNHPDVSIDLRFADPINAVRDVEDGNVELALCSCSRDLGLKPKLRYTLVWSDTIVPVIANNHPLVEDLPADGGNISIEKLSTIQSILPYTGSSTRQTVDNILQASNHSTSVCIEAQDFETIKEMATVGLGWACLPEYLVDSSLTVLPVAELEITHSVTLVTHRERTLSRAAEAFIDILPIEH